MVADLTANSILLASVGLFALGRQVSFWKAAILVALSAQGIVFLLNGGPESFVDLVFLTILIVPSTIMGLWVGS